MKVVKETKKTDCDGARRCLLKYKRFMSLFLSLSLSFFFLPFVISLRDDEVSGFEFREVCCAELRKMRAKDFH